MSKKKRGRKPGPNNEKINAILKILEANPQGIWVREISRLTGLKRSTISLYINTYLADKIEDLHDKALPVRLIRLKKGAFDTSEKKVSKKEIPEYIS